MKRFITLFAFIAMFVFVAAIPQSEAVNVAPTEQTVEVTLPSDAPVGTDIYGNGWKARKQSSLVWKFKKDGVDACYTTFTWDMGDGSGAQSGTPYVHTFPAADTYSVQLSVAGFGCSPAAIDYLASDADID